MIAAMFIGLVGGLGGGLIVWFAMKRGPCGPQGVDGWPGPAGPQGIPGLAGPPGMAPKKKRAAR